MACTRLACRRLQITLGRHAFIPGRIVHTNEVLCPLTLHGSGEAPVMTWRTVPEAVRLVDKQIACVDAQLHRVAVG
ncbi:hypothetical protein EON67_11615, partial [archaeon]